jgi:hypothetical protein
MGDREPAVITNAPFGGVTLPVRARSKDASYHGHLEHRFLRDEQLRQGFPV